MKQREREIERERSQTAASPGAVRTGEEVVEYHYSPEATREHELYTTGAQVIHVSGPISLSLPLPSAL